MKKTYFNKLSEQRELILDVHKLKKSIKKFENMYIFEYGILPKGNDREPIKDLYYQYNLLKTLIKENAARIIQSSFRSYLKRRKNKTNHSNNKRKNIKIYHDENSVFPFYNDQDLSKLNHIELNKVRLALKNDVLKKYENNMNKKDKKLVKIYKYYNKIKVLCIEAEKKHLLKKIKNYEKEFKEIHGRTIKYPSDIKAIQDDYKRYKEIKDILEKINCKS